MAGVLLLLLFPSSSSLLLLHPLPVFPASRISHWHITVHLLPRLLLPAMLTTTNGSQSCRQRLPGLHTVPREVAVDIQQTAYSSIGSAGTGICANNDLISCSSGISSSSSSSSSVPARSGDVKR